jgi:hypothetical protein
MQTSVNTFSFVGGAQPSPGSPILYWGGNKSKQMQKTSKTINVSTVIMIELASFFMLSFLV